jgi:hypothetical protein
MEEELSRAIGGFRMVEEPKLPQGIFDLVSRSDAKIEETDASSLSKIRNLRLRKSEWEPFDQIGLDLAVKANLLVGERGGHVKNAADQPR